MVIDDASVVQSDINAIHLPQTLLQTQPFVQQLKFVHQMPAPLPAAQLGPTMTFQESLL